MAKILSILIALAAVLFVAYALPRPQEEGYGEEAVTSAPPAEGGEGEAGEASEGGEATTQNPCKQFEDQCKGNGEQVDNGSSGQSNNTQGNTMPPASPQCQMWEKQCENQNNMPVTPPAGQTAPGGLTQPTQPAMTQPTQPSMNMTQPPAEMPNQNSTLPSFGRR